MEEGRGGERAIGDGYMGSQGQGAGGNVERDLPKRRSWPKQVPQVPHCGLPGCAQEKFWHLPRLLKEIFHVHLNGLSHSLQASLQPDSPLGSAFSSLTAGWRSRHKQG